MKRSEIKEIKKFFDQMDSEEQWAWLVNTDLKNKFTLQLDNDNTTLQFDDDEDCDYLLTFTSDIGTRSGLEPLLQAIGVRAEQA